MIALVSRRGAERSPREELRGRRNAVGSLVESAWLENNYHGLQLSHGVLRFHRIRDFKQYYLFQRDSANLSLGGNITRFSETSSKEACEYDCAFNIHTGVRERKHSSNPRKSDSWAGRLSTTPNHVPESSSCRRTAGQIGSREKGVSLYRDTGSARAGRRAS